MDSISTRPISTENAGEWSTKVNTTLRLIALGIAAMSAIWLIVFWLWIVGYVRIAGLDRILFWLDGFLG
jgi:hypothetical protein